MRLRKKYFYIWIAFSVILIFVISHELLKVKSELEKLTNINHFIKNQLKIFIDNKNEDLHTKIEVLIDSLNKKGNAESILRNHETCQSGLVCKEVYKGNLADLPWHGKDWQIEDCTKHIKDLLSILIIYDQNTSRIVHQLHSQYPGLKIIIGHYDQADINRSSEIFPVPLSKSSSENPWFRMLLHVNTPFVVIGHKIRGFAKYWGNFERAIRIIDDGSQIGLVSTATKNRTGHWKSHCWQAKIQAYNLVLEPGYQKSKCDCMICSVLWENHGPFIARAETLNLYLDGTIPSNEIMFMDLFLKLNNAGLEILSCPDLLIQTSDFENHPSFQHWSALAQKWKFLGVSIEMGPAKVLEFSCETIGTECNPTVQTKSILAPWCCTYAANHIVTVMNKITKEVGVHYELDSGSLLGAVKLNNFIPWDVDGDIYIRSEDIEHFHKYGMARYILESEGIEIYGWNQDNYWDIGAGHYQLRYKGLEFELMGKRGNLTLTDQPTLVPFGHVWAPGHDHPGSYLRGRYGPNYLRHAQSWIFVQDMANAFDSYSSQSGSWNRCPDDNHACLEKYPTDGNYLWLPHRYP